MNTKIQNIEQILKTVNSLEYHLNVDISHLSTMRLKSMGNYAIVNSTEQLKELIPKLKKDNIPFKMIGWGANQILPKDSSDKIFIKLKSILEPEKYFEKTKENFWLPAGLGLNVLVGQAMKQGFMGWEVLTGIPASLGGATFMNAGTKYGDISKIISRVKILDDQGNEKIINIDKDSYGYRKNYFLKPQEIITEVEVFYTGIDVAKTSKMISEYLEYRKKTQPLKSNNCGCIFKNPLGKSAGQIIDQLGLKGKQIGQMKVSTIHGNFLENVGDATDKDFWNLIEFIQEKVEKHLGEKFELEISS